MNDPEITAAKISRQVKSPLILLLSLGLANGLILGTELSGLRLLAGLVLAFALPGLAWLRALNWLGTRDGLERITLVGGLGAAISATALLGAVYWPGPLTLPATLIALDLAVLLGLAAALFSPLADSREKLSWPDRETIILLLIIFGVALFLRTATLGYGEFHEDELENLRLGLRAMKGEEYAPFLDSKGPVHWFLPIFLWLATGWINETIARLPFVFCSLLTVLTVFGLGRRMAGGSAVGLIGAALVALNGFFVAYARHVENPSLIILWGALAAWCAYRFYQTQAPSYLGVGCFLLAIGLVAHPDVLLYLPPFGLLVVFTYWHKPGLWRRSWPGALAGGFLFIAITASFYVPYLGDPSLERTKEYLAAERIGTELIYNGLKTMFNQDKNYSTRYYAPFLVFFSGLLLAGEWRKYGRLALGLAAFLASAAALTLLQPGLWQWGRVNGAFLPYALLLALPLLGARTSFEVKSLLLWFGVPFMGLEFLAKDAADHIQIAYPAWSLLAALGFRQFWGWPRGWPGQSLKVATVSALGVVLGLILYYQWLQFLGPVSAYRRLEAEAKANPGSIPSLLYGGLSRPRRLFSNPRLGGWKVVGMLYEQGILQGDFRSIDESFAVPIWYTYQRPRSCFTDPQNYFVSLRGREPPRELAELPGRGYSLTRIVRIDGGVDMLYLFEKGVPSPIEPQVYDLADYARLFDHSARPERYAADAHPPYPLDLNFGGKLLLRGYDAGPNQLRAGDTLAVTLYWRALAPMATRYRAFVHVETDQIWGQHDDDPACRLRTDEWRPPQSAEGQFRVTLKPHTPPGLYPVTVGVYHPETWERFEIFDAAGQSLGSQVELFTIQVE